ncbi:Outer spore wall protein RRT8 [Grifola frondosa]|uniref:Outer spore wall protein RRT8 n=1 Tax=Grifola frondosa TaxID=5627 RepID=A0A1C7MBG9_GRIFR|nr:Outer spore wall protein RRT8 [Grifola frondosa]
MSSSTQLQPFIEKLVGEGKETALHIVEAIVSLAWLWPLRGIFFSLTHPHIILSVRNAVLKSLLTSVVIFVLLAFFTYLPQAAVLAIFTGPLAPIFALFLVGAESLLLLTLLARPLFLEPALTHVFDATLLASGQAQLVKHGKTRARGSATSGVEGVLARPLQAFTKDGVLRYVLTLPLNFVPAVGTVLFLLINGYRGGPGWHARYFQLKGFTKGQRIALVEKKRAEYTAFGMVTLLFNLIPLLGLVFTFTNTIGAALWAARIEAESNLIESAGVNQETSTAKIK